MTEQDRAELLCRVDFPLYAATMISPRHILLAGGGGAANTGVKNGFEIFEITTNGEHSLGESVTRFVSGEYSIMTVSGRPCGTSNNNEILIAAGQNEFCQIYSLSLARRERDRSNEQVRPAGPDPVRHRHMNGAPGVNPAPASPQPEEEISLVYKTQALRKVQIDYNKNEPYGKVVRISPNGRLLASGGDDGHVRVWSFPELNKVHDFQTHEKEVDDVDFSPDSSKLASISKDKRAIIWDVKKGKKHAELGWEPPQGVKFMFKRIKFGCVEGDSKKYKVYTISNPMGSSKVPSYLHRWNAQSYTVEGTAKCRFGNALSAMAISDNGTFLATGTMSEGIVDIYTTFNLRKIKTIRNSHSYFITGLEFLPTGEESAPCRGFSEASVVSISVDRQVCIHHIHSQPTVSSFTAMLMIAMVLVATFMLCNYLGI